MVFIETLPVGGVPLLHWVRHEPRCLAGAAEDDRAEEKMQSVIGNKVKNRPIIIQDTVNIFLIAN